MPTNLLPRWMIESPFERLAELLRPLRVSQRRAGALAR